MEELKLEFDLKPMTFRFNNPTRAQKNKYLQSILPLVKQSKEIQKKIDSDQDFEESEFFNIQTTLDNARHALLLELNDRNILKTTSDFDKFAVKDLEKLYAWLQDAMGLSQKKQDF